MRHTHNIIIYSVSFFYAAAILLRQVVKNVDVKNMGL